MGIISKIISDGTITQDGTYELVGDVSIYTDVAVEYAIPFGSIKDTPAIMNDLPSVIPHLTGNTSHDGYVASTNHTSSSAFYAFDGKATRSNWNGYHTNGMSSGAWVQIQRTNGTIRADRFTVYQGTYADTSPSSPWTSYRIQIQGSNDGVNWDILVDDAVSWGFVESRTYTLDKHVSYSHMRLLCVRGKYHRWFVSEFLIQDSTIHNTVPSVHDCSKSSGDNGTPVYSSSTANGVAVIQDNSVQVTNLTNHISYIYGRMEGQLLYRLHRKGTDGTPTLIMSEPTTIGSSLSNTNLSIDLTTLASKEYVADEVDKFSRSSLAGKVDTYEDLPKEDVEVGTMYLVGTEGNLEEYIFTEDLKWERMGEIRQSDVDLSGYTTTEGLTDTLTISSGVIDTNIETMRTDIQSYLDTLEQEISGSMGELPLDSQFQDSVPTEWDSKLSDRAMLFVTDTKYPIYTIEYVIPELTSDGVPFIDDYAVGSNISPRPMIGDIDFGPYKATALQEDGDIETSSLWLLSANIEYPIYFNMYFKEPTRVTGIEFANRKLATWTTNLEFTVEASHDGESWVELGEGACTDGSPGAEWSVDIDVLPTTAFNRYRLNITKGSVYNNNEYVCMQLIRPVAYVEG